MNNKQDINNVVNEKIIQTKICKHCNTSFEITDKDLEFYEKISPVFNGKKYLIPTPTLCPDCRQQRRLTFRNERKLYKRKSDLSGKEIISIYSPDKPYKVYSQEEWWSDKWNALDYGKDFDFSKGFFEQFDEFFKIVPLPGLLQVLPENSDYTIDSGKAKNCYMSSTIWETEDCLYVSNGFWSKNIVDGFWLEYCELCYNSICLTNCYELFNSAFCYDCSNSDYLFECKGVKYSNFCVGLINKSYYFLNEEYSKEDYTNVLQKLKIDKKFRETSILKFKELLVSLPKNQWRGTMNEQVFGDDIYNSKNCYNVYDSHFLEDCKFVYQGGPLNNSYDVSITGTNDMKGYIYDCISVPGSSKTFFSKIVRDSNDVFYSVFCYNSSNLFACIGLRNKQYCIFNKQYTKEEYEILVPKIIEYMQKTGEYGEFFSSSISPFGYNEVVANEYFPLTKEEALKQGFNWCDYESPIPKVDKIIPGKMLPDDINKIPDDVLNRAIKCEITGRPFLITKQELEFYRKHNIPIPKRHPDQRHEDRMRLRNPRKLFNRKCDKCGKEIKTTYSPERPEIVYCEECYNEEV